MIDYVLERLKDIYPQLSDNIKEIVATSRAYAVDIADLTDEDMEDLIEATLMFRIYVSLDEKTDMVKIRTQVHKGNALDLHGKYTASLKDATKLDINGDTDLVLFLLCLFHRHIAGEAPTKE